MAEGVAGDLDIPRGDAHGGAEPEQLFDEGRADVAGRARDEDG
jgi:hypothetical protein